MFATIPSSPAILRNPYFAPSPSPSPSPAPLSTHNVNVPPRRSSQMSMSKPNQQHPSCPQTPTPKRHTHHQPQQQQQHSFSSPIFQTATTTSFPSPSRSSPSQTSSSAYATRYARTIHNPVSRIANRALSRDNRRNQFLHRIQRARDESAFDARAERMLGVQCVSERREFLERMERMAPVWGAEEIEGQDRDRGGSEERGEDVEREMMGGEEQGYAGGDEAALEEFLSEEQKFQAFVEQMEQIQQMQGQEHTRNMTYDDDDDYDNLFANLASHDDSGRADPHDMMDTSQG